MTLNKFKFLNDQQICPEIVMWLCLPSLEERYEGRSVIYFSSKGNNLIFRHVKPNMFIPHHDCTDEGVEYRTYEILSIWRPFTGDDVSIIQVDTMGDIETRTRTIDQIILDPVMKQCHIYLDHFLWRKRQGTTNYIEDGLSL